MRYKSNNLDFLNDDMKVRSLCFHGENYYFESDLEIEQADPVSDSEFEQAIASIIKVEQEPTQLERIEANTDYNSMMNGG